MHPQELSSLTPQQIEEWLNDPTPGLIKFWAPWCAPCKMMDKPYESVAEAHPQFRFATLNIDVASSVAARFQVRGIPCIQAWKEGKQISQVTGAMPVQALNQWVDKLA